MKTWKILFIVILISAIGFGILPLRKKVAGLRAENQKLAKIREQKIAEYEELTSSKTDEKAIVDPELRIPRNLAQTELLVDLQKISSKTGIKLPDSWSFAVEKDSDLGISKLGVSFPIKGSRGEIYKFLQQVEQNERFLEVASLSIQTFSDNGVPTTEMPINLTAYSQEIVEK